MITRFTVLLTSLTLFITPTFAQEVEGLTWDLNQCINHAIAHNIQVKKKVLEVESSKVNLTQTKSGWFPNLTATASENVINSRNSSSWDFRNSTSLSIGSSASLFDGGALYHSVKQKELGVKQALLDIEITQNSITLAITQAYLNVLYAMESLDYANEILMASDKQVAQTRELLKAGKIARKDLAQIESQRTSDNYALVLAQNNLTSRLTDLKQLLEIPAQEPFSVVFPNLNLGDEIEALPSKDDVFSTTLGIMPEMKREKISESIAQANLKVAKAAYFPSLSVSASYSTDFNSGNTGNWRNQLEDNQMQRVGLSLNIPIFSRNQTRTSVQLSKINLNRVNLTLQETEKDLIQRAETVYQNTEASMSRYISAVQQLEAVSESFRLYEEQFNLGMLTSLELLQAKNTLLNAKTELMQAKYSTILNRKILDFYLGNKITL